jgi:hypothetical protein
MSNHPERKTIFSQNGRRIIRFEYPKHYTLQQRGITLDGNGYGRIMSSIKVPRIQSEHEREMVVATKKGLGKMPKALHSLYFN